MTGPVKGELVSYDTTHGESEGVGGRENGKRKGVEKGKLVFPLSTPAMGIIIVATLYVRVK